MGEKRHRLYVRLHKRRQDAAPLSFPFHVSILLCKKTLDDTRSAVTFYLIKSPSKLHLPDENKRSEWYVEQTLCNPQDCADVLAQILVAKLPSENDMPYYEDCIAKVIKETPILHRAEAYDTAVWTWDVLNRLKASGPPFDSVPHILGTTSGKLEQEMVFAAFSFQSKQASLMAGLNESDDVEPMGLGKILPASLKRRVTNSQSSSEGRRSGETRISEISEANGTKQLRRDSYKLLQACEMDFRNRVDEKKDGPYVGWRDHWYHTPVGWAWPPMLND